MNTFFLNTSFVNSVFKHHCMSTVCLLKLYVIFMNPNNLNTIYTHVS